MNTKKPREGLFGLRPACSRKYFQPRGRLPQAVVSRLAKMDGLVPGDFHAVETRLGFVPDLSNRPEVILAELDKERMHRKGKHEAVEFANN